MSLNDMIVALRALDNIAVNVVLKEYKYRWAETVDLWGECFEYGIDKDERTIREVDSNAARYRASMCAVLIKRLYRAYF